MKKSIVTICLCALMVAPRANADLFGGDVAVLMQILSNAIQQLAQLKQILDNGQDSLSLMQEINRGINDSLALARTIDPNIDPGIFKDWDSIQEGLRKIEEIYGIASNSPNQRIFQDVDQGVAEAIRMNNSVYEYANQIDQIGESIKTASHLVSPGGAQKLTAQSMGVMLHMMGESLRTQATQLKLNAQRTALENKRDKDSTREYLQSSDTLRNAMKTSKAQFNTPRF